MNPSNRFDATFLIRNGAYFLQGWIAWGDARSATRMTEKEAAKTLARVHAAGCIHALAMAVRPRRRFKS